MDREADAVGETSRDNSNATPAELGDKSSDDGSEAGDRVDTPVGDTPVAVEEPERVFKPSVSKRVSAAEQQAIAEVIQANPQHLGSNIRLAQLANAGLGRSEDSPDRITPTIVAAAKGLKSIKQVVEKLDNSKATPPKLGDKSSDDGHESGDQVGTPVAVEEPERVFQPSVSKRVSAAEQQAIAEVIQANPQHLGSNIRLAQLANAGLGRSEESPDRITSAIVAAAKGLKSIKQVIERIAQSRAGTSSKPSQKTSEDLIEQAVAFLSGHYSVDPRLFSKDKLTAAALNKALKLKAGDRGFFTPTLVTRLKRTSAMRDLRESLRLTTTSGKRKRWERTEYLAAVRTLNKYQGPFRQRLRQAEGSTGWKGTLPGRTWTAVAGKLMLLWDEGQLRFDAERQEFYYDPEGMTTAPKTQLTQFWNRFYLLESLAHHADVLGEDNHHGIAEAIEEETGVAVTSLQVQAGLRSQRYAVLRLRRTGRETRR
jgi:hypothetical protein